jgi:integrase
MLLTGARPAELLPSPRSAHVPLLKTEISFADSTITIRTAKRQAGKARKSRVVPVPAILLDLLRGQIQTHPGETVFQPQSNLARGFDAILARAGIAKRNALGEKLTAHSFRHTHATLLSAQGESQFAVQSALGHSQIATTARYVHAHGAQLQLDLAAILGAAPTPGAKILEANQ